MVAASSELIVAVMAATTADQALDLLRKDEFLSLAPEASEMFGCTQGTTKHLEGDVACHTALVFQNTVALARARFRRDASLVERLVALLHDIAKPCTRVEGPVGTVSFPDHEALGAPLARRTAVLCGLAETDADAVSWLVRHHGEANAWPSLDATKKSYLSNHPNVESLVLIHEADAMSCLFLDGSHLPIHRIYR